MGEERKQSGVQTLLTGLFSPATAARMEADSRMWMLQCPHCSYERSIWEIGGIRYKALGNPRSLQHCPNCNEISWHKIYRREGPPPEVPVAGPESKRPPRWLMWVALAGIVGAFFVLLSIVAIALALAFTQPVVNAGERFMTALKRGDYEQAYTLCTPELQSELVSQEGLTRLVQRFRPVEWSWSNRSIRNGVGRLSGTFTYAVGEGGTGATKRGTAHLELHEVAGEWKLAGLSMNPAGQSLLQPYASVSP